MSQDYGGNIGAMLYDWHNSFLLRAQLCDIDFWMRVLPPLQRVVVMGAGTGRVAVPLAVAGHSVIAVDRDYYRLARTPAVGGLVTLHSDFVDLRSSAMALNANHVIFPYSAMQLVPPRKVCSVLEAAAQQMVPDGYLWIDVSSRFECRPNHGWQTVLVAPCSDLGTSVIERQRGTRGIDHYRIDALFLTEGKILFEFTELWYFLDDVEIQAMLIRSGFSLVSRERGYGTVGSNHRRIYKAALNPR